MRSISKVFVAAAVAGACGYASAAAITADAVSRYASEGAAVVAANTVEDIGSGVLTLGGPYVLNDELRFEIDGALFATAGDHAAGTIQCESGGDGSGVSVLFTLIPASSSTSTLVYAAGAPEGQTANQTCDLPNFDVLAGSLATADNVTISTVSRKAATLADFDSATAVTFASVGDAVTASVNSLFDAVIDVQNDRLTFESGNSTAGAFLTGQSDEFAFSVNVDGTRDWLGAGGTPDGSMTLTLTAAENFNYLIEPGTTTCDVNGLGAAEAASDGGEVPVPTVNSNCSVITVTFDSVGAGEYRVILGRDTAAPSIGDSAAFTEQAYTAGVSLAISDVNTVSKTGIASGTSAGSWGINGTSVTIPYLPISSNIDLVINVSNRSAQTGNVSYVATNRIGEICSGELTDSASQVLAQGNASLGAELRTDLLACAADGTFSAGNTSRATVRLTIPTPQATTEVNSSFSVSDGKSRQLVINTTN